MVTDYTSRLPNQLEDSSNLKALISIMAGLFEESNGILRTLRDDLTIDGAEGAWLDEIGDIVGVARGAVQVSDQYLFTFATVASFPGDRNKGYYNSAIPSGGHFVGFEGLSAGVSFSDSDYRDLIRAKVASTYSGDSIPEMYTWIVDVFGIDCKVYTIAPAEIGIDIYGYLTHTQRRILLEYIPRGAGIDVSIVNTPGVVVSEDGMEFITESKILTDDNQTHQYIKSDEINGTVTLSDAAEYALESKIYHIKNISATPWKIVDSASNQLVIIYPDGEAWIALVDTGTTGGTWDISERGNPIAVSGARTALDSGEPASVDTRVLAIADVAGSYNASIVWHWSLIVYVADHNFEVNSGTVRATIKRESAAPVVLGTWIEYDDGELYLPDFDVGVSGGVDSDTLITLTATITVGEGVTAEISIRPEPVIALNGIEELFK
jgi:hypothetical protein